MTTIQKYSKYEEAGMVEGVAAVDSFVIKVSAE